MSGTITGINAAGSALWGWNTGDKTPEPLFSLLLRNEQAVATESISGRNIQCTSVQQMDGWLLIGHGGKGATKLSAKSSIKTLIENRPTFYHAFPKNEAQGVLFLDREGNVLHCGRKLRKLFYPEGYYDAEKKSYLDLGLDIYLNDQIALLLQERIHSIHSTLSLYDDAQGIEVFGTPILDTGNNLIGALLSFDVRHPSLGSTFDPTRYWGSTTRVTQLKNAFIAMMSHEIRTPLGVMNGYAEILAQELDEYEATSGRPLPPQIKEFVSSIHENTQRILSLVNELFDLSNMHSLPLSPIAIHEILRPVAEHAKNELSEKGIDLEMCLASEDLVAISNPGRLSQILYNLLSNATKFTSQGCVTIRTSKVDTEVIIEITDTGVGISQDYLDQLFTPFAQEDIGINRKFEGAGLGLALVKLLVDLMKGRIEVDSKKNMGSTFRIFLPAA